MRGSSAPSSRMPGLCSGEEGPRLRSRGALVQLGGGDMLGLQVDVGLLAPEGEVVDRSRAPTLTLTGELRESLRV